MAPQAAPKAALQPQEAPQPPVNPQSPLQDCADYGTLVSTLHSNLSSEITADERSIVNPLKTQDVNYQALGQSMACLSAAVPWATVKPMLQQIAGNLTTNSSAVSNQLGDLVQVPPTLLRLHAFFTVSTGP